MHPSILAFGMAVVVAVAVPPTAEPTASVAAETAIANVIDRNRDLHSFTADLTTSFRQRNFPFVHLNLSGKVYFQGPDRYAVAYSKLPGLMKGFPEAYAAMLDVPAWPQLFVITADPSRMVNKHTDLAIHLTPRDPKSAFVSGELLVDASTWTIDESDWVLQDNVHFTISQKFETAGAFRVLADQQFAIQVPFAHADGGSTFKNYQLNVPVDEAVFATH